MEVEFETKTHELIRLIADLSDGKNRLENALRSMNEKNFKPLSFWSEERESG